MSFPAIRHRRLRQNRVVRDWVRETQLSPEHLIQPVFVLPGEQVRETVPSMPGVERLSLDLLLEQVGKYQAVGIRTLALFPVIPSTLKSDKAEAAYDPCGLMAQAIRALKAAYPDVVLMTDVALDPYTTSGHDGILNAKGEVDNDETVAVLVKQAICQAQAGADMVAPSDMMDGRVGAIREALEAEGFTNTLIMAYAVKFVSAFYGPFRDAVGSAVEGGYLDKSTYQVNPANRQEALREVAEDIEQGADIVMIKPGMPYLDVLHEVKQSFQVPTFVYQVSGEYAMLKAAGQNGWVDGEKAMMESLLSFRRAGADAIVTYFAYEAAQRLAST